MTTYNSNKCVAGVQPKFLPSAGGVNALALFTQATALASNDIVNMVPLLADPSNPNGLGPTILGLVLDTDKLDSGGSAAILFSIGDATTANRYFNSLTLGQTGGYAIPTVPAILGYQPFASPFFNTYTTVSLATYTILLKCNTAAQTAVTTGQIRLCTEYTYDP